MIPLLELVLDKWDELIKGRAVAMIDEVLETGRLLRSMYEGDELDGAYETHVNAAVVKMAMDLLGPILIDLVVMVSSLPGEPQSE